MTKNKPRKAVLVLEANAKAALPILESCAAQGLYTIAAATKKRCCGFYSRATRQRLVYPSPEFTPEDCLDCLIKFLRTHQVSVMFPVGDVMTDLIARHQELFRQYTNLLLPPYDIFVQGRNKILSLKAAAQAGCPIPHTWYPHELPLQEIAREVKCPVLIKPAIGAGARGLTRCDCRNDLIERFPTIESSYGKSFIQEFIPQTGMQYKVDAILDHKQKLLAGVVYSKLRYYPSTGGSSVINKTVHRPDILEAACKIMRQLNWVGFCDFDFITDPRDNIVKFMEINPRYPESYQTTVAAGIDMTKIMYQLTKGDQPVPQLEYKTDRYVRFLCGDIMWFLTTKNNRLTTKPSFFKFYRDDMIYQIIRSHDLGPIMGYFLENLDMLRNKQAREFKLRLKNV